MLWPKLYVGAARTAALHGTQSPEGVTWAQTFESWLLQQGNWEMAKDVRYGWDVCLARCPMCDFLLTASSDTYSDDVFDYK